MQPLLSLLSYEGRRVKVMQKCEGCGCEAKGICLCNFKSLRVCVCNCSLPQIIIEVPNLLTVNPDIDDSVLAIKSLIADVKDVMGDVMVDTGSKIISITGLPSVGECVAALNKGGFEAFPVMETPAASKSTSLASSSSSASSSSLASLLSSLASASTASSLAPSSVVSSKESPITIGIEGMTCHSCTDLIKHALASVTGIRDSVVDLEGNECRIWLKEGFCAKTVTKESVQAIEDFGFAAKPKTVAEVQLNVMGMTCGSCTQMVSSILQKVPGVTGPVSVSLDTGIATIPGTPSIPECISMLAEFDYEANEVGREAPSLSVASEPFPSLSIAFEDDEEEEVELIEKSSFHGNDDERHTLLDMNGQDENITVSEFSVSGITCASCVNLIQSVISGVPGICSITVNPLTSKAVVSHLQTITPQSIVSEISALGFPTQRLIKSSAGKLVLEVQGTQVQSFIPEIESHVEEISGVTQVQADPSPLSPTTFLLQISYTPGEIKARDILENLQDFHVISQNGLELKIHEENELLDNLERKKEIEYYKSLIRVAMPFTVVTLIIMVVGMTELDKYLMTPIIPGLPAKGAFLFVVASIIQFGVGRSFYEKGWKSLKKMSPSMDVLVALGTSAAYFTSTIGLIVSMINPVFEAPMYFETSIFLIAFVVLGRYLENYAKSQTSQAISKLFGLQATEATLIVYDSKHEIVGEKLIDVKLIEVGDHLILRPGDKIPCDGETIFGNSSVDESMITGESIPVSKKVGSPLIGGTINQHGLLHMVTHKVGSDTALSQIIQLVSDAQNSKGETQKLADKISGIFVPVVIVLSLLTFIVWDIITGLDLVPLEFMSSGTNGITFSLLFAMSVLVIACPCALGLATPTAVMVGTGVAARHHVLIKGSSVLDVAHKVDYILFDKTGTLTLGKPKVTDHILVPTFTGMEIFY
eukprot:TRINITY_DN5335_c0_g1_i2.p1 TRINITY_DN5335_c0_g1~~TRINITY_DN5335_c0_g1_i2.p1  ORF type:complete len:931 (-),score=220.96 TRINITY_DN5335_c0_g1_i2:43-2835(-)